MYACVLSQELLNGSETKMVHLLNLLWQGTDYISSQIGLPEVVFFLYFLRKNTFFAFFTLYILFFQKINTVIIKRAKK